MLTTWCYYTTTANNGYSGDLELAFLPDHFRKDILKETEDANGVLVEGKTNEDSKEVQTEMLEITATPLPSGLVKIKTGTNTTDAVITHGTSAYTRRRARRFRRCLVKSQSAAFP